LIVGLAAAPRAAEAEVCVVIDEGRDTFAPQDRSAALLLVDKQFEREGERIVPADCPNRYTLSHVTLGNTITVTLSGPNGDRQGMAIGFDDLPALYSQMVRSIVTGRPMSGFGVVDRTNVTSSQASPRRVGSDGLWYARLGYGGIFGGRTYGTPAVGFGYRAEFDSFGIDVSFLNVQVSSSGAYASAGATTGAVVKLEVLRFTNPVGNKTGYFGGGVGWGATSIDDGTLDGAYGDGSGLEGDLTAGYELARASTVRLFTQVDAVFPLYNVTTYQYSRSGVTTTHQYAPSVVFSLGLGWGHGRQ
jgi:hypothetical protein